MDTLFTKLIAQESRSQEQKNEDFTPLELVLKSNLYYFIYNLYFYKFFLYFVSILFEINNFKSLILVLN